MEDGRPKKRNQIAVACNECRKRKIKCDGTRPRCKPCAGRGSYCNYDADPDATPIIALKRKYEQLQQANNENEQLLHMLKTRPEEEAQAIFRHLRSNSDFSSTLALVRDSDLLLRPKTSGEETRISLPSFEELTYYESTGSQASPTHSASSPTGTPEDRLSSLPVLAGPSSLYSSVQWRNAPRSDSHRSIDGRAPSGIPAMFFASNGNGSREESNGSCSNGSMGSPVEHRAVPMKSHKRDARLIGIRAADWGVDYVNDDDFADIITSYFTWDHPHSRLFDEDLFLEGLQNPRTEFCSSLLVNAILAIATKTCTSVGPAVTLAASQTASTDAARLWDLDTGNDHLASIPAGVMLQSSLHQNSGSVRGRLTYVRQAVRIAQSMGLFRPSIANSIYDPALPITTRGRATIAWAVYEHQRNIFETLREDLLQSTPPPVAKPYRPMTNGR